MNMEIRAENQRLFSRHPEPWAWVLVVDRLEAPLRALAREARAISHAKPSPNESAGLSAQRFKSQSRLVELYAEGIAEWVGKDLVEACGGAGKAGDLERIDERCGEILAACRGIIEAEEELVARPAHSSFALAQSRAVGLSLDFIGPLIGMVASLRKAIRAGATPILRVEFNSRRLETLPRSGKEPASFPSVPLSAKGSIAATGADEVFAAVVVILIGVGIAFFIGFYFWVILFLLIFFAPLWFILFIIWRHWK